MNLYQDVTETEIVDADVDVIQVLFSAETTAVYGLSYSLYSVADAAAILSVVTDAADAAVMTAVSGSSCFSSSAAADAAEAHGEITDADATIVDATIADANKTNFKDGIFRPFFIF